MAAAIATSDPAFMASLPPIPVISATDIARRVVTHPSFNGEPTQSFEFPENMGQDYRRDAVILSSRSFLTELLYERFPRLTPGAATIILSASWSNATLARLAEGYGLHRKLRAALHQRTALVHNGDVRAALFEAHLYGLHLDNGKASYDGLKTFIKALFTPLLAQQREAFATSNQVTVAAADGFIDWVSRLNIWCQRRGRINEYVLVDSWGPAHAPEFTVSVKVNDVLYGIGTGNSIKAARQEAAAMAVVALLPN